MAIYNEILVPRFARAVQKLFGVKGTVPTKQLSGEIISILPLFFGAEGRYLEGWNLYANAWQIAAGGAGNRTGMRFRNPKTSNAIVVIQKLFVNVPSGQTPNASLSFGSATVDLANVDVIGRAFDARSIGGSSMSLSHQNSGALPALTAPLLNPFWQVNTAGNQFFDVITTDIQEFPIAPGDAFQWDAGVDNTALNIYVWWRERFLEESERF